ncbi:hypothetical protein K505DRAFT_135420 [Melanomma pulvis-pyrius CBS 109.77]|uniref:Uncharacterized protein n=1 Tax=Melanomma pulvis-pyrius CBS 109.77 TaxID=1314802 RepID=A0A6A6WS69_9PLEO|nr:hypothetical protein K505DRAFT_135420 [Melanomma pulvis-pyrius CBS 109.77]
MGSVGYLGVHGLWVAAAAWVRGVQPLVFSLSNCHRLSDLVIDWWWTIAGSALYLTSFYMNKW